MRQQALSFVRRNALKLTIASGILMISGGLLSHLFFPLILNTVIDRKLKLETGTRAFEKWRKPPIPIQSKVYIFDVTNADQFVKGLEKPKLVEKGPYVYK
jgi:CD36 family